MRPIARVLTGLVAITLSLPATSVLAASALAPSPSTSEDCADLSTATLPTRDAAYGWKVAFYNSTFTGTNVSYTAGTNICNGSDAKARANLVVEKGAANRALGAAVTITVVGNTDSDKQNTNNAYLSIQRALYGRWLAERAMGVKYGSLPEPAVSTSGVYYLYTYNYPSGGDVVVRTKGVGSINATGTTTAAKRLDRNATIDISVDTPPPTTSTPPPPTLKPELPPTAVADVFSFTYGDTYKGDVSDGDTCSAAPCFFTVKPIPASQGSLSVTGAGVITFTPPKYFVGKVTFDYTITAANGRSDTATDTITVSAPAFPTFVAPTSSVKLTAPAWARLGVNERFSATSTVACPIGFSKDPARPNRCTSDPAQTAVLGSYVDVTRVQATGTQLYAPSGYPSSRYAITSNPANKDLPTSGTVKFSQATPAGKNFELVLGYFVELHYVKFTRFGGTYTELPDAPATSRLFQYASASASIGVVGNTAR